MGALRRSMATTGYSDIKEFQKVEVVIAPYGADSTPVIRSAE
jgi:IMP dehydrogenase